jgi:hypothetical protein
MFAYRRKRSLGCEQLEGRFAPSSFWVGGGSRSPFKDAPALETTQAEQAAFFLAASAVVSQSSSVANVAPITFDQPAAGEAEGERDWWNPSQEELDELSRSKPGWTAMVVPVFGMCMMPDGTSLCRQVGTSLGWSWSGNLLILGQPTNDGTSSSVQPADDSGVSLDVPSVDPISPETPSEQGNDADAVGAVPSEELPAGGDDVTAEDFLPAVDDTPVAGDEVADLVGEDTGLPDASHPEEMPRCGNDFEDRGLYDHVKIDPEYSVELPSTNGSDEIVLEDMPVESQYEDAEDEVAPVDV